MTPWRKVLGKVLAKHLRVLLSPESCDCEDGGEQKGRPIPAAPQEWGLLSTDPTDEPWPRADSNHQHSDETCFVLLWEKGFLNCSSVTTRLQLRSDPGEPLHFQVHLPPLSVVPPTRARRPPCIPLAVQDKPISTRKHNNESHKLYLSPLIKIKLMGKTKYI